MVELPIGVTASLGRRVRWALTLHVADGWTIAAPFPSNQNCGGQLWGRVKRNHTRALERLQQSGQQ